MLNKQGTSCFRFAIYFVYPNKKLHMNSLPAFLRAQAAYVAHCAVVCVLLVVLLSIQVNPLLPSGRNLLVRV